MVGQLEGIYCPTSKVIATNESGFSNSSSTVPVIRSPSKKLGVFCEEIRLLTLRKAHGLPLLVSSVNTRSTAVLLRGCD